MHPFIDLQPVTKLVRAGALERWSGALERCEFVGGAPARQLERALREHLGLPHALACASGTSALALALSAAGVRPGDHVAMPNLTFWATFEAIAQLGAIPVLVDIDGDDLQLDLDELRAAFDAHRFRHAVLVHLFGWASARTAELRRFCREREIALIEDGAQCFGVELDGAPLLAGAQLATLSFYPAKVLGGCMDGGAVLARDEGTERRARSLANHGRAAHYEHEAVGWSSRMSAPGAHYLLEVLAHASAILRDRRASARRYLDAAAAWPGVRAHRAPAGVTDNGYLCVLECVARPADELARAFAARGVATARTYPSTMDEQAPAAGRCVPHGPLTRSRAFARRALNLPLYYGLPRAQQDEIIATADELLR
ncbi:MAG: DegT/DnrJ/EryC1/StrS family aminotransferase [Kofleriaceae bacterium]